MKTNTTVKQIEKAGKHIYSAEIHALNITRHHINRKRFNRFLRILGPGLVTGAADDDPSGIATYSQAGARFGFSMLWVFPVIFPMLLAVQESCARIGAVTGKGLAAVIKDHYNKSLLYSAVALVVIANTINIGADLGAMVAAMNLVVPLPAIVWACIFAAIIVTLEVFVSYKRYAKILKWLAISLFAYPLTAFLIGQPWGEIIRSTFTFPKRIGFDMVYLYVAILGTTISPYLFFWDTSETVENEIQTRRLGEHGKPPILTKHYLKSLRTDNFVGMTLTSVTAWFIVIVCASVLFANGTTEIQTAADAARALEPLVANFPQSGMIAKILFSAGIIGIGLLAIPVLAGSSSYAISEALGWQEGLRKKYKRAKPFYLVIAGATLVGLLLNVIGIDPIQALIFTAVFNAIAAVPLLLLIARIGSNKNIMGEYTNSVLSNTFVRLTFAVMAFSALILFYALFTGKA
jgi:NRAMP (natural resistance-associated macrophage protein)-like metal ion transporter